MDASSAQATPPQTMREFERALRTLGFTRLQAQHIAVKGFQGVTAAAAPEPEPKADTQLTELRDLLKRHAADMKD